MDDSAAAGQFSLGITSRAVLAATLWVHSELAVPRIWLEIHPGNEPSLRLTQRVGYQFEQRIPRHCRAWTHQDVERDAWHDCLIWIHNSGPGSSAIVANSPPLIRRQHPRSLALQPGRGTAIGSAQRPPSTPLVHHEPQNVNA